MSAALSVAWSSTIPTAGARAMAARKKGKRGADEPERLPAIDWHAHPAIGEELRRMREIMPHHEAIAARFRLRRAPMTVPELGPFLRALRLAEHWSSVAQTLATREHKKLGAHVRRAWLHLDGDKEDLLGSFVYRLLLALESSAGQTPEDRAAWVRGAIDSRFPEYSLNDEQVTKALAAWPRRPQWNALLTFVESLGAVTFGTSESLRVSFRRWKSKAAP